MPRVWTVALILSLPPGVCPGGEESSPGEPARLAPALRRNLPALLSGGERSVRIRARSEESAEAILERLRAAGVRETRRVPGIRRVEARVAGALLPELAADPRVEWIEEEPQEDLDRDENDQVRQALGVAQDVRPPAFLGRGVHVGSWEAGHADLESQGGDYGGHDDLAGRLDLMEDSNTTFHATQVAGVLAGSGWASKAHGGDATQWRGVAPGARILSYSTVDSDEETAELWQAAQDGRIHLALMAWGEWVDRTRCEIFGDYNLRAAEFDGVIAGSDPARAGQGAVPVVFSVGNYQSTGALECPIRGGGEISIFPGFRTVNPPHTAKNIIAVGAVYSDDLGMTRFSSWGPTDDGRLKPDLVGPGAERGGDHGITSCAAHPPDGYEPDEGTSFSAAAVSGLLAILMADRNDREAPPLPPAAWKAILVQASRDLTADPLAPAPIDPETLPAALTGRFRGPDYFHGYGLPDLNAAREISQASQCLVEGHASTGATILFTFRPDPEAEVARITLAWDDPAGDPAASKALVNDLDLYVIEELSFGITRVHQPWALDPQFPDLPAVRQPDRLNNLEQVEIDGPTTGPLTVVVWGADVPRGPQRFWLAVGARDVLTSPTAEPPFRRGDTTRDGQLDISDAILVLWHLFQGSELGCVDSADSNDDGNVDVSDVIRLLSHLFLASQEGLGGPCQVDPTADTLGCEAGSC